MLYSMNKNTKLILISVAIIGIVTVVLLNLNKPSQVYFKQVKLDSSCIVFNSTKRDYIDTIVKVGAAKLNIKNVIISVEDMPSSIKSGMSNQGLDLKAFVEYKGGVYYLAIDDIPKLQSVEVISHEMIHVLQYNTKRLVVAENSTTPVWEGTPYPINQWAYDQRPWEVEAFKMQYGLEKRIDSVILK